MKKFIIDSTHEDSFIKLGEYIFQRIFPLLINKRTIVFLCIGSDRCTGDSLGPLVGEKINFLNFDNIYVYGNLENTVNALNLKDTISSIQSKYVNPYIIAIDASLGNKDDIGKIFIEEKALNPGKALDKDLPSVGDLSIVGIVNVSSFLQFSTLQSTRLFVVMKIASTISNAISYSIIHSNLLIMSE